MARTDTLGNFLTDVADAIRTKKGSSNTILASDFDTEIENLPSGGITTPTSTTELNNLIKTLASDFESYVRSLVLTYDTYTNQAVTLYSPANNYNYYCIQKRSSGKYRVIWFDSDIIITNNNKDLMGKTSWKGLFSSALSNEIQDIFAQTGPITCEPGVFTFYLSNEYDTSSECVQRMLNNTLTYTTYSGGLAGYVADTPYEIPYTNASVLASTDISNVYPILSQRISQNETIQLM